MKDAISPTNDELRRASEAVELEARFAGTAIGRLLLALEEDFISDATEAGPGMCLDDEGVSYGETGESKLTFGMIRDARRELLTGSALPESTMIRRLQLQPGDMIVLSCPERLTREAQDRFQAWITTAIRRQPGFADVPVMVMDGGKSLSLLAARPSAGLVERTSGSGMAEVLAVQDRLDLGEAEPTEPCARCEHDRDPHCVACGGTGRVF